MFLEISSVPASILQGSFQPGKVLAVHVSVPDRITTAGNEHMACLKVIAEATDDEVGIRLNSISKWNTYCVECDSYVRYSIVCTYVMSCPAMPSTSRSVHVFQPFVTMVGYLFLQWPCTQR